MTFEFIEGVSDCVANAAQGLKLAAASAFNYQQTHQPTEVIDLAAHDRR